MHLWNKVQLKVLCWKSNPESHQTKKYIDYRTTDCFIGYLNLSKGLESCLKEDWKSFCFTIVVEGRERGCWWGQVGWRIPKVWLLANVTTKVLVNLLPNFPTYNLSSQQRQTAKRTWLEMPEEGWLGAAFQNSTLTNPASTCNRQWAVTTRTN